MKNHTSIKVITTLLVCALLLAGCKRSKNKPLSVVFVIDMTASTDAEGRAKAFKAVQSWFEQKRLQRGDRVTVIPVTGDAWTESQGRILRFNLSERREAYDGDLRRLGEEVISSMERMESEAAENPYKFSDILGAVQLGAEELQRDGGDARKVLVVLSDFVQDDGQAKFKTASYLADKKTAQDYAKKIAAARPQSFEGDLVYLGLLRSTDLKSMSPGRREALQVFWSEYFRQASAREVITATDGPGQMERLLKASD
jgi:Mg-chelatase subunit ChlD